MKSKRLLIGCFTVLLIVAGYWLFLKDHDDSEYIAGSEETNNSSKENAQGEDNIDSDKQVKTTPGLELPTVSDETIASGSTVTSTEEAQTVVNEKVSDLELGDDAELIINSDSSDEYGYSYYHIGQEYKGVPIYGATSVLYVEQDEATIISGSWVKDIDLNVNPTFDAKTSLRMALDEMGVPDNREVNELGNAELIVFPSDQGAKLCWRLQATLTNPVSEMEVFIVDAHVPEILIRNKVLKQ